ncbi:MAG: hypothetical protein K6E48_09725 [Lachnospiraceae bacterium]|nr:hypothetical protein [Lachnospiraceae bacterium]
MKRMKVTVLSLVVVMMLVLAGCGASAKGIFGEHDFRNVNWQVDTAAVKDSEEAEPFLETENVIHYDEETFEGHDAVISYNFFDGKLRKGGVMITAEDEDEANQILEEMKKVLEKGYGKSTSTIGNTTIYETEKTVVELRATANRVDIVFADAQMN